MVAAVCGKPGIINSEIAMIMRTLGGMNNLADCSEDDSAAINGRGPYFGSKLQSMQSNFPFHRKKNARRYAIFTAKW